ncbi:uncharacterized protein LAJ45_04914 [Morchella importuna]|uniref:uncharacterized protein n=1 Tax=Morchella importuna TaxID=1174673 RepID=UPI001E8D03E4|nr:uncharacterized protein LAJ45_04914 [Morchella importuna]KAH8151212.1 hypothetical protein LAJ45_04914 [Morchella importuna]
MLARSLLFRRAPAARLYSTATSSPPLLAKIRSDMKDAMRAKDTNKLNVCRSLIAEISNASKMPTPPTTDIHLLSIITKTLDKSLSSLSEFQSAGRDDLASKEAGQIEVLKGYAAQVERVGLDEIEGVVKKVLEGGVGKIGEVMKAVMAQLEGRPVVQGDVAGAVQRALKK